MVQPSILQICRFTLFVLSRNYWNGVSSEIFVTNRIIKFIFYSEWHNLTSTCCPNNKNSETCDFYSHVTPCHWDPADESDGTKCGDLVEQYTDDWLSTTYIDSYNIYQDCYESSSLKYYNTCKAII